MSALLAVVQAVVSASPSPSPTVAASVAPVAQAAQSVPVHTFWDTLNSLVQGVSQTDIVALGSALAVSLQALLNRVPFFRHAVDYVQDVRRFALAVVVPGALAVGVSLATGHNDLGLTPWLFLGAQVVFYACKVLIKSAVASLARPVSPAEAEFSTQS